MRASEVPLAEIVPFIDWSPFFATWELRGTYPRIFENETWGARAKELFDDAQGLLKKIVDGKLLTARAVHGFFPANAQGDDILVYADRTGDQTWMGLSSLIETLPYLAAYPLARFLSETSTEQMDRWGREALEGILTLVAYIAYTEHCALGGAGGAVFKGFRHRSAGPLWAMFKRCAAVTGPKWQFGKDL